jgi:hypothetical protein
LNARRHVVASAYPPPDFITPCLPTSAPQPPSGDLWLYIAALHALSQELVSSNRRKRLYGLTVIYRNFHPNQFNCAIPVRFKHQIMSKDSWSSQRSRVVTRTTSTLGGAVAAILFAYGFKRASLNGYCEYAPDPRGCYVYGSPRLADREARFYVSAFAVRRELDIVPSVPPRVAGYRDVVDERTSGGELFIERNLRRFGAFLYWIFLPAFKRVILNHRIEAYISDIHAALPPSQPQARSTAFQPRHSEQLSGQLDQAPQPHSQAKPSDLPPEDEGYMA